MFWGGCVRGDVADHGAPGGPVHSKWDEFIQVSVGGASISRLPSELLSDCATSAAYVMHVTRSLPQDMTDPPKSPLPDFVYQIKAASSRPRLGRDALTGKSCQHAAIRAVDET